MGALLKDILKNSYTRLLVFIFISLTGLALYFIAMIYLIKINDAKNAEIARLEGISHTISSLIKANEVNELLVKYPHKNDITNNQQDAVYQKYQKLLREIQESNQLSSPIYTMVWNPEKNNFYFVFTSAENPYYRHEYNTAPEILKKNYTIGGVIPPYKDEHGMWMSAFMPIKNEKGQAIAVLQVDELFDKFIIEARKDAILHLIYAIIGFILFGIILYRKTSQFLEEEQKIQLKLQFKNHQITSSIEYAKRIQEAILPPKKSIQTHLDSFIFYKPKDIVSGDFYWFSDKATPHLFLAVVDCTGHGVPGAFMSMIGNTILNKLINEKLLSDVSEVLNKMEIELRKALNRTDEYKETSDGMDIALINICKESNTVSFAGAQRPLFLIRNGKLTEIKGTKRSIGYSYQENSFYEKEEFIAEKGDCLYLFTDGFQDQFGEKSGKKLMKKQLKEILLSIHEKSMAEQEIHLEQAFLDWKGTEEQVDDVLVIGIKV